MFNNKLKLLISQQQATIDQLTTQLKTNQSLIASKDSTITQLQSQLSKFSTEVLTELDEQVSAKQSELSQILSELGQKENEIHLTSLSFFNLEYNSQHYKDELKANRLKQKEMLISKANFTIYDKWFVNGNQKDGNKLCSFLISICVNSFNQLSDATMKNVNVSNYQSLHNKLTRAYKNYNDNLVNFNIKLNESYLELKLTELELNRNVSIKLDEEKEKLAREKEILREQIRVDKELEREREKLEVALVKLRAEQSNGSDVQDKIDEIEEKLGNNDKLLKSSKAGWIYIINCPAFGKDTWKVGLSRRISADERINELSSASVPFLFKPNCILWTEDAFKLEYDIHNRLNEYRINKINMRKEFFKIPLIELEKIIKEEFEPNAIFDHDIIDYNFIASGYKLVDNFVDKDA